MTDVDTAAIAEGDEIQKPSKKPLLIGLILAVIGGGGGFYAASAGLIPGLGKSGDYHAADSYGDGKDDHESDAATEIAGISFVPIDPLVINLGQQGHSAHLRFVAQLEVDKKHEQEVRHLMPRVVDVLNGYLRAVDVADLEAPTALIRLRAQMLRRVQVVAGRAAVRDLLISEFVLN